MSPRSACFIDEAFFGKKQNFWSWGYSPQVPDYQDFQFSDIRLKESCCIIKYLFANYKSGNKMNLLFTFPLYDVFIFKLLVTDPLHGTQNVDILGI